MTPRDPPVVEPALRIVVDDRERNAGLPEAVAALWSPTAVGGLRVGDHGGRYAFSSGRAEPMLRTAFRDTLAGFVHQLDVPLQNMTIPKVCRTSPVAYLGGLVEILDAKASGKGPGDADENAGAGRLKASFTGTMLDDPCTGQAVKGQLTLSFEDASGE